MTYTDIIEMKKTLELAQDTMKEELELESLRFDDVSISASTTIASVYLNSWTKEPDVKRSCGMSAEEMPETVAEFKKMQKLFKDDAAKLTQIALDWKEELQAAKEAEFEAQRIADEAAQKIADEANKAIKEEQDEQ